MNPEDITRARETLGHRWGLGRPLTAGELAHLLRLRPANGSTEVLKWEAGQKPVTGPVSVALDMMLAGAEPPTKAAALAPTSAPNSPRFLPPAPSGAHWDGRRLVVPDGGLPAVVPRGHVAAYAAADEVVTRSGQVLKSKGSAP